MVLSLEDKEAYDRRQEVLERLCRDKEEMEEHEEPGKLVVSFGELTAIKQHTQSFAASLAPSHILSLLSASSIPPADKTRRYCAISVSSGLSHGVLLARFISDLTRLL